MKERISKTLKNAEGFITLPGTEGNEFIYLNEIVSLEATINEHTIISLISSEKVEIVRCISEIASLLPGNVFMECIRYKYVNIRYIRRHRKSTIKPRLYQLLLADGNCISCNLNYDKLKSRIEYMQQIKIYD